MDGIKERLDSHQKYFDSKKTLSYEARLTALKSMLRWIEVSESSIFAALKDDLGKSDFESYMAEVGIVREELNFAIKNLKKWMKPKKHSVSLAHFPSKSWVYPQPYGVVLIMSPWNYPFQLTINPLIGAIAAGNCCVVKPSAYSPKTSKLIDALVSDCFVPGHVSVVLGGREQNSSLLQQKFDYIFFTGGAAVGRLVMEAAIPNLTPVALELGGKSPCIVDKSADIPLAAKRIVFGKFMNAGQTCVAPDHIYVHESVKEALVRNIIDFIQETYGECPIECPVYPRIVNKRHFDRLMGLMEGADMVYGGIGDSETLKISPTIIDNANWDMPVMGEEIFGPILPILSFSNFEALKAEIKSHPHPLALYIFTRDKAVKQSIIEEIPYGGGCINDTIIHIATPKLPFGGVGNSGMGQYHGKYSFETFSHQKSVLEKAGWLDMSLRYLPSTEKTFRAVRKFIK